VLFPGSRVVNLVAEAPPENFKEVLMPTSNVDKFVNIVNVPLVMSAANTITFEEINIGLNLFDKVGLLLTRLEFDPVTATLQDLDSDGDSMIMGLTSSANLTSLVIEQAEVIDQVSLVRVDAGAAANFHIVRRPITHDFSTQPGGGLLVPPKPLYAAGFSAGMTVAGYFFLRLYFIIYKLNDAEYLELLETRRAFG